MTFDLISDHKFTVARDKDGKLKFLSNDVITDSGYKRKNTLVSVVPTDDDVISPLYENKQLFSELKQINLILTNACNLSCTYCYEQHNKDFGRFTEESLFEIYTFLSEINDQPHKIFQFFGGEPLIHKKLILSFLKKYHKVLTKKFIENKITVSLVTNGLLLDKDFIDEYFSYDFTHILLSLDTDDVSVDNRGISQDDMDALIENIKYAAPIVLGGMNKPHHIRFSMRLTLAVNNAVRMTSFIERMHSYGVLRFIVNVLIYDFTNGFIDWNQKTWNKLEEDLQYLTTTHNNLIITFSEGVGQKKHENCLVGSDMIAIDASGDLSGCYFFTNHKADIAGGTILGNILEKKVYVNRYKYFTEKYNEMFDREEECKTCDYRNACYQCPAGNIVTYNTMFMPTSMCKKIVKLFLDLQDQVLKKTVKKKFDILKNSVDKIGINNTFSKAILYMIYYDTYKKHPSDQTFKEELSNLNYKNLLSTWNNIKKWGATHDDIRTLVQSHYTTEETNISDFYYEVTGNDRNNFIQNDDSDIFYLTMLHVLIMKNEHKSFPN